MKIKNILFYLLILFLIHGCKYVSGVRGNGISDTEVRPLGDFSKISVSGSYNVDIAIGDELDISITTDENLIPMIRTEISGKTLNIYSDTNLRPKKEIQLIVTVKSLSEIDASGASSITLEDLNEDDFKIEMSGACNIYVSGQAKNLMIELSGAGSVNTKKLKAENVNVEVSGACFAEVYAEESISAEISGVGSIDYYGNPKDVKSSVSGVGKINRK